MKPEWRLIVEECGDTIRVSVGGRAVYLSESEAREMGESVKRMAKQLRDKTKAEKK